MFCEFKIHTKKLCLSLRLKMLLVSGEQPGTLPRMKEVPCFAFLSWARKYVTINLQSRVVTSPWRPVASALALKALVMQKCNLDLTLWHHIKIAAFHIDWALKIMLIL